MSEALDIVAAAVLEDGRRWGDAAAPFQWEDARAILDERSATPYHFLTRARGGSKTADLGLVASAAMLAQAPAGARLYGLAADRDQGGLLLDSIDGYRARTPELRGALGVHAYRVVAPRSGAALEILAADAASSWGLRPWFTVVDELAAWASTPGPRRVWEAVTSAAGKVRGARLVVLTTAGDPAHHSHRVLEHARRDPLWRVNEVPGPPPWADPERLAEQRRRLPESVYQRLFENRWVSSEDRLVSADDLRACVVLDGPRDPQPGMTYRIGVDLGLKRDRTVAAVCHLEDRVVTLDRMAVWQGTRLRPVRLGDVEEWLERAAREYRASVTIDPWQAAGLVERLRRRAVRIEEYPFSQQSVGRLASTLYLLLRERALRLPDDEELLDELANIRLRETSPGVLRMDHDPDRHDDRAIALALAAHRLVECGEQRPATVHVPTGSIYDLPHGGGSQLRRLPLRRVGDPLDPALRAAGIDTWTHERAAAELDATLARGRRS